MPLRFKRAARRFVRFVASRPTRAMVSIPSAPCSKLTHHGNTSFDQNEDGNRRQRRKRDTGRGAKNVRNAVFRFMCVGRFVIAVTRLWKLKSLKTRTIGQDRSFITAGSRRSCRWPPFFSSAVLCASYSSRMWLANQVEPAFADTFANSRSATIQPRQEGALHRHRMAAVAGQL